MCVSVCVCVCAHMREREKRERERRTRKRETESVYTHLVYSSTTYNTRIMQSPSTIDTNGVMSLSVPVPHLRANVHPHAAFEDRLRGRPPLLSFAGNARCGPGSSAFLGGADEGDEGGQEARGGAGVAEVQRLGRTRGQYVGQSESNRGLYHKTSYSLVCLCTRCLTSVSLFPLVSSSHLRWRPKRPSGPMDDQRISIVLPLKGRP